MAVAQAQVARKLAARKFQLKFNAKAISDCARDSQKAASRDDHRSSRADIDNWMTVCPKTKTKQKQKQKKRKKKI